MADIVNANKYISKINKYKTKYETLLGQKGGDFIPDAQPTQSWIFMPILLSPFANIELEIPDDTKKFIDDNLRTIGLDTFDNMLKTLKQYYVDNNINLDDCYNLTKLNIKGQYVEFDGDYHINAIHQENILEDAKIKIICDAIVPFLYMFKNTNNYFLYIKRTVETPYTTIHIPETTKCLDDNHLRNEGIGPKGMTMWDCYGNANQRFKINEEKINNKIYYTISRPNENLCMNIEKPNDEESQIGYKNCNDANRFEFMKKDDKVLIRAKGTEKCFDHKGNIENGSTVVARQCDFNNQNQYF